MGCDDTTVGLPFGVVAGVSASGVFLPMTPWRSTDGVDEARSQGEMRAKNASTCTVTLYVQYTNDVRSPAGQAAIGSSISANGMLDPTTATPLTATLAAYRYCRFGWWVVGDGTNLGLAWMGGVVSIKSK